MFVDSDVCCRTLSIQPFDVLTLFGGKFTHRGFDIVEELPYRFSLSQSRYVLVEHITTLKESSVPRTGQPEMQIVQIIRSGQLWTLFEFLEISESIWVLRLLFHGYAMVCQTQRTTIVQKPIADPKTATQNPTNLASSSIACHCTMACALACS